MAKVWRRSRLAAAILLAVLTLAACGGSEGTSAPPTADVDDGSDAASEQRYPDVVEAVLEPDGERWTLAVTISSPYDTPERYADGWRVLAPDGTVLGDHELAHDHANEQPFTRTQRDLAIPEDVDEVTVEGRDLEYGYGGGTVTIPVP